MSRIFLSYRREDSTGWTGRLSEHLKERFGSDSIFMDIDTIVPGADFTEALQEAVSACDVLLAVIGPDWATATDTSGKLRIDDPIDWVRVEISTALKRKIRVIPVLVGGASVPTKDLLPDELDGLAQRQAHELTDKRWNYDVEQLINSLSATHHIPSVHSRVAPTVSTTGRLSRTLIGVLVLVLAIGVWVVIKAIIPSNEHRDETQGTTPLLPPETEISIEQPSNSEFPPSQPVEAPKTIFVRAGQEARLKNKSIDYRYQILAIELQRYNSSMNLLHLHIRFTNDSWPGANFWNDTFRLLVEGVPRAPVGDLNEIVEPHSAKDNIVEFTVPETVKQVTLQLRKGEEIAEIPINLTDRDTARKPSPAISQQASGSQ